MAKPNKQTLRTIRQKADKIIALKAKRKAIGAEITEQRGEIKGLGICMADFNDALRLYELEGEERASAMESKATCFEALQINVQGDLFGSGGDDADDVLGEPEPEPEPEPSNGGDAYAETVGPETAKAAKGERKAHRYPRPKFAGGAQVAVLDGAFSEDETLN